MPSKNFSYQITEHLGNLSEQGSWTRELNLVSWNGAAPKFDLRPWGADHASMGKGFTFSRQEAEVLYDLLGKALGK